MRRPFQTTSKPADLPTLPAYHTREQLLEFRHQVAALPGPVSVPRLPKEPTPEQVDLHRRAAQVHHEQTMAAQREHERTDPKRIAERHRLARIELAHLDAMIGRLQARRAELNAALVLNQTP